MIRRFTLVQEQAWREEQQRRNLVALGDNIRASAPGSKEAKAFEKSLGLCREVDDGDFVERQGMTAQTYKLLKALWKDHDMERRVLQGGIEKAIKDVVAAIRKREDKQASVAHQQFFKPKKDKKEKQLPQLPPPKYSKNYEGLRGILGAIRSAEKDHELKACEGVKAMENLLERYDDRRHSSATPLKR